MTVILIITLIQDPSGVTVADSHHKDAIEVRRTARVYDLSTAGDITSTSVMRSELSENVQKINKNFSIHVTSKEYQTFAYNTRQKIYNQIFVVIYI
jgi:hypothetical protein